VTIISHHHSVGALQSRGYCQQGAWAAIGRFESAPAGYFSVEVAAAAAGGGGWDDDDDDNDDDDDDDDDDNNNGKQKTSGGGIILVPRAECRRDHRGMASVTTTIGDRKRKATDGPV